MSLKCQALFDSTNTAIIGDAFQQPEDAGGGRLLTVGFLRAYSILSEILVLYQVYSRVDPLMPNLESKGTLGIPSEPTVSHTANHVIS